MKIALILALARYLMYRNEWSRWRALVPPFVMTFVPMILIIIQPDLGTALLFLPVLFGMLYLAGARPKHLATVILAGVVLVPLVYNSPVLKDYQRERITSFLQHIPSLEAKAKELYRAGNKEEARKIEAKVRNLKRGIGYQQYFSQVSIGSGGLIGQGLNAGPQNRLNYLPESHTDFIFAILGEEWGFLGCNMVLLLFLLVIGIILGISRRTREPFGRSLCGGVGILIGSQVFVNTAITVGLLPIAGLTLPFMSYGGSSLLSSFAAIALVLDVGARRIQVFGR
jgi:rod shape determining protein RodA